jgi:hypothetical protein
MRRFVLLLAVTALLVAALAVPAFATASPTANCLGGIASGFNQLSPGFGGQQVGEMAQRGETGELATFCAHSR